MAGDLAKVVDRDAGRGPDAGQAADGLRIRNLDGRLSTVREISSGLSTLRTSVEFTSVDHWDGTTIDTFRIRREADGAVPLEGTAVFAVTPAEQLAPRPACR